MQKQHSQRKVVLINPPQTELHQPTAYIPLGLGYIAAVLEQSGMQVEILNLANTPIGKVERQTFPEADFYGITCPSALLENVAKLARLLRGEAIIGGVHATICPEETSELTKSRVMMGEAEYAFRDTVLSKRSKPWKLFDCGIILNLDGLPLPARHLFAESHVIDTTGIHGCEKGVRATTMMTSRGCPFHCAFCVKGHPMFSLYRERSPDNIRREIVLLQTSYGVQHIRFVDDIFTFNRRKISILCGKIQDLGITFSCITRADCLDDTIISDMKKAGCVEIHIGVESGSNRLLQVMLKNENTATYLRAIKKIKKHDIRVKVYLMANFPTETSKDVELTKKFMLKAEPDKFTLSNFTLLPGSDVANNPWQYGLNQIDTGSQWFYLDEGANERYASLRKWLDENVPR